MSTGYLNSKFDFMKYILWQEMLIISAGKERLYISETSIIKSIMNNG